MDLSKLPKLSETDKHAPPPPSDEPPSSSRAPAADYAPPPAASGADVWFNIAIGIIIQLLNARFWSWVVSSITGSAFTWSFTDVDGSPIAYSKTVFFFGDLAMVLFGLVLIFDGITLMMSRRRGVLLAAFGLTCIATALNLFYLIGMMSKGYGLQLMSAIAIAFGGYIAMNQWKAIRMSA
jgi:hypothetical protein